MRACPGRTISSASSMIASISSSPGFSRLRCRPLMQTSDGSSGSSESSTHAALCWLCVSRDYTIFSSWLAVACRHNATHQETVHLPCSIHLAAESESSQNLISRIMCRGRSTHSFGPRCVLEARTSPKPPLRPLKPQSWYQWPLGLEDL